MGKNPSAIQPVELPAKHAKRRRNTKFVDGLSFFHPITFSNRMNVFEVVVSLFFFAFFRVIRGQLLHRSGLTRNDFIQLRRDFGEIGIWFQLGFTIATRWFDNRPAVVADLIQSLHDARPFVISGQIFNTEALA
jgi:hypothetical protein